MDGAYKHGKFLRRTGITETGEQLHQIFCGQRGKAERERESCRESSRREYQGRVRLDLLWEWYVYRV